MPHRVVLIGSEFEENLSLRYLAAAVQRDGFEAHMLPFNEAGAAPSTIASALALEPLVIGISVPFQMRAPEFLALAQSIRSGGFTGHIVIGGHFATFEYLNILRDYPAIDSVVRHEGELTLRELCVRLRDDVPLRGLGGAVLRDSDGTISDGGKRQLPPLDELPFPDRRGPAHRVLGVPVSPVVGSRGCYADCSFCCIYAYAENADGARYRRRSPEDIAREMREEYLQRGVRLFVFHDDNFFVPSREQNLARYRRLKALLDDAAMTDIAIVIKCRPNDVTLELFTLLKEMGLIRTYVGIETNSDEGIVSLNRRITSEDNRRALQIFRELGLYHSFNVLIFDPEATLDGIRRNLDFMEEFAETPFNFCRAEVYAGTPLKAILEHQGRLSGDYFAWGYEMRSPVVELLFRIVTTAFASRNFKADGVANLNMGIRVDNEVMHRFYPECWDEEWEARVRDFSRRLGLDSVAMLREGLAFVEHGALYDGDEVKRFTLALARRVARSDLAFLNECKVMRREMERRIYSLGTRVFASAHEEGRPPWAAETGRLGSSTGLEISSELLPAPSQFAEMRP